MKKFKVEITQHAYREGVYEIEAPDLEAAYVLASDIKFDSPSIVWTKFLPSSRNYPRPEDIYVEEKE